MTITMTSLACETSSSARIEWLTINYANIHYVVLW